ncbi:MAG: DUF1566 domain-containing protein [Tatlockia sp.]|nr:DUF1566 domain-containing protein [Tatlockia sp.]
MIKHPILLSVGLAFLAFSSVATSSPASKEYVDKLVSDLNQNFQLKINAVTYTGGEGIALTNGQIKSTSLHHIGELYQGGIVFFVDDSGLHGLVSAKEDISLNLMWQNGEGGEQIVNAGGDGIFAGDSNTRLIIAQQTIDDQQGDFAALQAANFKVNQLGNACTPEAQICYGGWSLPSLHELTLIYLNLNQQGLAGLNPATYWSSTEASVNEAWSLDASSGEKIRSNKINPLRVRPIRAF